jgi:hypothetical protein
MQLEMEPPPAVLVSFSDVLETRVCGGRETCGREYVTCTQAEKSKWQLASSSRNTNGKITCWVCGDCMEYYDNKGTTHRRGLKATFTHY